MITMSKEKFVRNKPHVNIGLFIMVLVFVVILTLVRPQEIPPGNIIFPVESVLRPNLGVLLSQGFLNGLVYGTAGVLAFQAITRTRIPKHSPEWTN
jgi:heme A synthase